MTCVGVLGRGRWVGLGGGGVVVPRRERVGVEGLFGGLEMGETEGRGGVVEGWVGGCEEAYDDR